jgi:serpin B
MKIPSTTILFVLLTLIVNAQSSNETVSGNNTFAFEFYRTLFSVNENTFISPYSISSALAMTYAGAKNETERQMKNVMHYYIDQSNTHQGFFDINTSLEKSAKNPGMKLSVANALWKKENFQFKKDFLDLAKKYYDAAIYPLKGAKQINDWADKKTNGKIKEIVSEGDVSDAKLVLTNAIYFKADWLEQFKEKNTFKDRFHKLYGGDVEVQMMNRYGEVKYFEDNENKVIELPYKGEKLSMILILPNEKKSIMDLIPSIDQKKFAYYNSKLFKHEVSISIPKFSFETEYHLNKTLSGMGMIDAFNPDKADFSGMSTEQLYISDVIHKAFIEVNEKGSEAAAVTAVIMKTTSVERELVFYANRPFMFLICDMETKSILFMGSVMNPNPK